MITGARRGGGERQAGTTLLELLIGMSLSALIGGSILGAFNVGINTTDATTDRLTASHGTEIVDNYFPRDVASAGPAGITTTAGDSGCSGGSPGNNVVLLSVSAGPGDDQRRISYRFDDQVDELWRFECIVGGTPRRLIMADHVASVQAAVVPRGNGQARVTMVVTATVPQGVTFEVTGYSRTPTVPPSLPDPAVPTTAPPLPCTVSSSLVSPSPVAIASGTSLTTDVTVSVGVSGSCVGPLYVSFVPGSSAVPVVVALIPSTSTLVATLGKSAYPWTAGTKTITVEQTGAGAVLNPTLSLVVSAPVPCVVTGGTATPNPVNREAAGRLATSVAISVTTTGPCSGLQLQYLPQASAVVQGLTQSGSTWTGTIPTGGGAPKWNAGSHTITVLGASNSFTFSLVVNP